MTTSSTLWKRRSITELWKIMVNGNRKSLPYSLPPPSAVNLLFQEISCGTLLLSSLSPPAPYPPPPWLLLPQFICPSVRDHPTSLHSFTYTPTLSLTLLHSERHKLYTILAFLTAIGLTGYKTRFKPKYLNQCCIISVIRRDVFFHTMNKKKLDKTI